MTRKFAKTEGGTLMARGLYRNLVTHLVMLEGEGLIETEDIGDSINEIGASNDYSHDYAGEIKLSLNGLF